MVEAVTLSKEAVSIEGAQSIHKQRELQRLESAVSDSSVSLVDNQAKNRASAEGSPSMDPAAAYKTSSQLIHDQEN